MKIDQVLNTNFEGRVLFDKNLSKPMREYANKIIDTVHNGEILRNKLGEKTFDITFFSMSSKKAIHPKLEFYSCFNTLNPKDRRCYNSRIRPNEDFKQNVERVSRFIDRIQEEKNWQGGYNTFFEKVKVWFFSKL